ncbi:ABC transporter permease [Isoptericola sp. NPDC056605]|uniref:ABC transporter permease n=1 Tax=Isoptericola sp. NPDC056605 TaxID=3345876 RepID=UPI00367D894A
MRAAALARRSGDLRRVTLRAAAFGVPVLLAVSALVFVLAEHSPLDPLAAYLGARYQDTSAADRAALSSTLGLDLPWWHGWLAWAGDLLHGDLGWSRVFTMPVADVFAQRVGWTLLLSGTALAIALVLGVVLGLVAGTRPGGRLDAALSGLAVLLQSVPPFVVALGAVLVFAVTLQAAPVAGVAEPGALPTVAGVTAHLALPAAVLAATMLPWMLLGVRTAAARAAASDAVRGARARGLPPRTVLTRHVLPVSLGPLVMVVGARVPELVVGAVLVEEVFGWPGIAGAVVSSAQALDLALLAALTVVTTAAVLIGSYLADVAQLLLDPRVVVDA